MIGRSPKLADFDHPLEMLEACHERIGAQCATLMRLAGHLAQYGGDRAAQEAARGVMRYFDTAGRHHHEDEEQDLFPRLLAAATATERTRVASLIEQLHIEHTGMEQAWQALRVPLERIGKGEAAQLDLAAVRSFGGLYRSHIALEESELLPVARSLLVPETMAALGRAMAARRRAAV